MMINCPSAVAPITGDGTSDGYITVMDTSPFYPSARVWLGSGTQSPKEYVITDVTPANMIGLREIPVDVAGNQRPMPGGWQYGRTPLSQWLVSDSTKIFQDAQPVRVEHSNYAKLNE